MDNPPQLKQPHHLIELEGRLYPFIFRKTKVEAKWNKEDRLPKGLLFSLTARNSQGSHLVGGRPAKGCYLRAMNAGKSLPKRKHTHKNKQKDNGGMEPSCVSNGNCLGASTAGTPLCFTLEHCSKLPCRWTSYIQYMQPSHIFQRMQVRNVRVRFRTGTLRMFQGWTSAAVCLSVQQRGCWF